MKTILKIALLSLITFCAEAQSPSSKENTPYLHLTVEEGQLLLHWELNKEVNTSFFIVQRSTDGGTNFSSIGTIEAKGYNAFKSTYRFEDYHTIDSSAQYRIVLTTMEGVRIPSNVVSLGPAIQALPSSPIAKK